MKTDTDTKEQNHNFAPLPRASKRKILFEKFTKETALEELFLFHLLGKKGATLELFVDKGEDEYMYDKRFFVFRKEANVAIAEFDIERQKFWVNSINFPRKFQSKKLQPIMGKIIFKHFDFVPQDIYTGMMIERDKFKIQQII